jgi:hypothetical protein
MFDSAPKKEESFSEKSPEQVAVDTLKLAEAGKQSWEALYAALDEVGYIKGSTSFYSAETLKNIISKVRSGELDSSAVTSATGLRSVVKSLLERDGVTKEEYKGPTAGDHVVLVKQQEDDGKEGVFMESNALYRGYLMDDIAVGQPLIIARGKDETVTTKPVTKLIADNGKLFGLVLGDDIYRLEDFS